MGGWRGQLVSRVVLCALVATVLGPVGGGGVAGATSSPTAEAPPMFTCADPPPGVVVTAEEKDRFVGLWAPRVDDLAYMQSFLDAPGVPADVLAEGFHALDQASQGWLVICLVEELIATVGVDQNPPGTSPPPDRLQTVQASLGLVIFGKAALDDLREQASQVTPVTEPGPTAGMTALTEATADLATTPVPPPPATSAAVPASPQAVPTSDFSTLGTPALSQLLAGVPTALSVEADVEATAQVGTPIGSADVGLLVSTGLHGAISVPVVDSLVELVETMAASALELPATLMSTPPFSLLSGATYRVCRESATLSVACTVPIPVGVPVPVGLTDDLLPDVLAHLLLQPDPFALQDITVSFSLTRLPTAPPGPLPFHVFAVYDPPLAAKRLSFGVDGQPSTIADQTEARLTVENVFSTLHGELDLHAQLTHQNPGTSEALTFSVKSLVSQGLFQPLGEEDPLVGAVQLTPVPETLTADLNLRRMSTHDQATLSLVSSVPTLVEALVTRDLTTTSPASHQELRARVDELPTRATVDLIRQGDETFVHYFADSGIDQVQVVETFVPDVGDPGTYTEAVYQVDGVPDDVRVTLTGGSDVVYQASGSVPRASVSRTMFGAGVLDTAVLGVVEQVPTNVHLNIDSGGQVTTVTYDADASLALAELVMFDRPNDETTLVATATGFPTQAVLTSSRPDGVVDYSADGPIASIEARLTRGGGSTLSLPGDHASVLKQGTGLGVELVLSGLTAFHVEPAEEARYSLTLDPGGQPFRAVADLDSPDVLSTLEISNLPATIDVTLDPVDGVATYQASSTIDSVRATFEQRSDGTIGLVELDDVPQTIVVDWVPGGATPQIAYDASGRLGRLHAFYLQEPGGTTFDLEIDDLPPYFELSGQDPFSFDARTSPAAPSGSSYLGGLAVKYASDGTFAVAPTTDDHVLLRTGPATEAELVYSGLRFVSVATGSKELHIDLRNTQERLFRAFLDTPSLLVEGLVDGVPEEIQVDVVGQSASYQATTPVDQVALDIDRRNGEYVAVDVLGIPTSIDLVLDSAAATVDWTASAPTGGLGVVARFGPPTTGTPRTFDTSLNLTGIPAQWTASFAQGHPRFEGTSGPIEELAATFTNHGTATVVAGDHLSVVYDQGSGDLDASLRISDLSLADFESLPGGSGGFRADLAMGDGSPFALNAQVDLVTTVLDATGTITNLPGVVHVESAGGRIQYTGDTNPDIQLSASYGSPAGVASTPDPPAVHGLAVRDGAQAVKAELFLTGFPRVLDFDPAGGVYTVEDFSPSQDLVIDAVLDDLVPTPVSALVTQQGIPAGIDFTYGPTTTTTLGDGTVQTHLGYVASAAMGQLTATATFGTSEAFFQASSVPSSLSVDTSFGPASKLVTVTAGSPVSQIIANFRHVGDASFAAGVQLDDVPQQVSLILGREDGGQGVTTPVFTYQASSAGLDITAFAEASLFGGDIQAAVDLVAVDLGSTVTADLVGKTLSLVSSPATASFDLLASGRLQFDIDLGFTAGPLENTGTLEIDLTIERLRIAFTAMSSLTLTAGITSAIQGSYGTFTLEEQSDLELTIEDHLVVDTGFGDLDLIDFGPSVFNVGNVVGNFRLAGNHLDSWINALPTPLPCGVKATPPFVKFLFVTLDLRPHPHSTTGGPAFTVSGAAAEGGAHIVTINPFGVLPDLVLDIIARFASPLGGDQGLGTDCV